MSPVSALDIGKLLEYLRSPDANLRRVAAEDLRLVSMSNEEIVRALVRVANLDSNKIVASAAHQTLDSTIHQTILQQHPEIVQDETQYIRELKIAEPESNTERTPSKWFLFRKLLLISVLISCPLSCFTILLSKYSNRFPHVIYFDLYDLLLIVPFVVALIAVGIQTSSERSKSLRTSVVVFVLSYIFTIIGICFFAVLLSE